MYGAGNAFPGQMMSGPVFSPQYVSTVNPSAYHPYGSPDDVYQQKMSGQFAGHNPSQYMPIVHPPRSLQAPDPRVLANMQNMVKMSPRWAMAEQQQPAMGQFNFNPSMFMRPNMGGQMPPTVEAVRAVEGQQRDILTQRAAEMARAKVHMNQMNQLKTLNSGAPAGTADIKPSTPQQTKVEADAPIKTESDSSNQSTITAPTDSPHKTEDTKPQLHLSLAPTTLAPAEIGPFTSGLPAEAHQFDFSDFANDQFPEQMLYRSFPLSEEFSTSPHDDIVSSATSMHAPVAFSNPFAQGSDMGQEFEAESFWFQNEGPQGEVDFSSFLGDEGLAA